jgi:hypothetical protein
MHILLLILTSDISLVIIIITIHSIVFMINFLKKNCSFFLESSSWRDPTRPAMNWKRNGCKGLPSPAPSSTALSAQSRYRFVCRECQSSQSPFTSLPSLLLSLLLPFLHLFPLLSFFFPPSFSPFPFLFFFNDRSGALRSSFGPCSACRLPRRAL